MEDTSVSSYISQTLTHLTNTWNTVNYTGANCFSDPHLDVIQREPVNVTLSVSTNENEPETSVTLFNATNENETETSSLSEESSRTDIQEKVRKFVHLFQNYNGTPDNKFSRLTLLMTSMLTLFVWRTQLLTFLH